jgi:hypothetical protein
MPARKYATEYALVDSPSKVVKTLGNFQPPPPQPRAQPRIQWVLSPPETVGASVVFGDGDQAKKTLKFLSSLTTPLDLQPAEREATMPFRSALRVVAFAAVGDRHEGGFWSRACEGFVGGA